MFELVATIEELTEVYPEVKDRLEEVLAIDGEYSLDTIITDVITGSRQMWIATDDETIKGVVVTKIVQYPETRKLLVHLISGEDVQDWAPSALEDLEVVAREHGCTSIQAYGRKGWIKMLGFEYKHTVIEKKV